MLWAPGTMHARHCNATLNATSNWKQVQAQQFSSRVQHTNRSRAPTLGKKKVHITLQRGYHALRLRAKRLLAPVARIHSAGSTCKPGIVACGNGSCGITHRVIRDICCSTCRHVELSSTYPRAHKLAPGSTCTANLCLHRHSRRQNNPKSRCQNDPTAMGMAACTVHISLTLSAALLSATQ